jgi:alpha-glucoside transport system permease protein
MASIESGAADVVSADAGTSGGGPAPADRRRTHRPRLNERRAVALAFLAPAAVMLLVLICYPILRTFWLSLHNADGNRFVGLGNYEQMFTGADTRRAIVNNVVWVVVAPTTVTVVGLIFAVLTGRLRRATALRTILVMPMAISFLAAGVTFRLVYDSDPHRGALNAAIVTVHDLFWPPSRYHGAIPNSAIPHSANLVAVDGGVQTTVPVDSQYAVMFPLVGLAPDRIPSDAEHAVKPTGVNDLRGVVWLDLVPGGGGTPGVIDPKERGLPGMSVEAVRGGKVVATATTDSAGRFVMPGVTGTGYVVRLASSNFTEPFQGFAWLGPDLITPAVIGAYIWIWGGFAMVLISAGIAALPRDALEAARVDGASEWQVFRLVTVPLVRPVLVVVLVTLVLNVMKIFDLLYVLPPDSSQADAGVVALEMYQVSFGGGLDYGLGSALAVLLFIVVLPAMLFRIRRHRGAR